MNCVYEKNQDEINPLPFTPSLGEDSVAWSPRQRRGLHVPGEIKKIEGNRCYEKP